MRLSLAMLYAFTLLCFYSFPLLRLRFYAFPVLRLPHVSWFYRMFPVYRVYLTVTAPLPHRKDKTVRKDIKRCGKR